jgi:hypothetical protein
MCVYIDWTFMVPMCMEPGTSIEEIESAVRRVLEMERRTPETVVEELGTEFVKQHEHLCIMLCEKDFNEERFMRMLELAKSVHTGQRDQNEVSEEVGMDLAIEYVDAVRTQNGKRRKLTHPKPGA